MKKRILFLIAVFVSIFIGVNAQQTIRILAIGNSFSEDAVEQYLYQIGAADGVNLVIGNMYIGGCSLETHWNNAQNNTAAYSYRKIVSGTKSTLGSKTLEYAITDEAWDVISFQQVSQNSGQYATYFPYLGDLKNYAASLATNPSVQFALHFTWAYAQNSTHSGFANYDNSQTQMYDAIVSAVQNAATTADISIVIPTGTAIQNGRTSFLGDTFNRDGYHLEYTYGRFTAACTWYEKLTGNSVVGNSANPASLSEAKLAVAQNAAHEAVQNPYSVTDLSSLPSEDNIGFLYDTFQTGDGGQLLYRKLLPYNQQVGEKYPLVLFLHGAGQRGSDNEKQLELGGDMFLNNRQSFPAFVLAPQCPSDNYWAFGTRPTVFNNASFPADYNIVPIMVKVKELLDSYLIRSDVDLNRIYIVGLSMGAMGTYDMACRFPDIFAAAVPICGGVNIARLTDGVENIYWRLYHGAADPTVPVENSRSIYQHLLGMDAQAEYIEYPNIQHEAWGPAFNSADFLSWIFAKTKQTPNDEIIEISNPEELNNIRNNLSGSFKLMNDIDLTSYLSGDQEGWLPIMNFEGKLNGNGKTISGLRINRPATDQLGLFGTITGDAEIRNLGIVAEEIIGNNNVTGLVGKILSGNVKISGCFVSANLTGKINVAGILANSEGFVRIENCYTTGVFHALAGGDRAGGILGRAGGTNAVIDKCYSTAAILNEGTPSAGGIVGSNANKVTISNCAAINPFINGTSGSFQPGRILSYSANDIFENNVAFSGMTSNQTLAAGTATNKNGADKTATQLTQQETFSNTLGWDFTGIWKMGNGCYPLPVLRILDNDFQPNSVLSHLIFDVDINTNSATAVNGTITAMQTVQAGSDVILQIRPNTDFIVNRLLVDGIDRSEELVENQGSFEFILPCVWENYTVAVYFKSANPVEIRTAQELSDIRNNTQDEDFRLMNPIDLTAFLENQTDGWLPIDGFKGNFDGDGYVISGLFINRPATDNVGLFGEISDIADIRDLGIIISENQITGKNNVGGLLGKVSSGGNVLISGCFVSGDIYAMEKNVGGIAGTSVATLKIENCYSTGNIHGATGSDRVGGILGFGNSANNEVDRCYSIASILNEGSPSAAGIVGSNDNKITISNCAAINPAINGKTTSYFSATRILCWEGTASYNNNIAFDQMLCNGSVITGGSLWNKNGADKTKEQLRSQETYDINALGWNFETVWTMGNSDYPLPVLKKMDVSGQPAVCPAHLQVKTSMENVEPNQSENQLVEIFDFYGRKIMQGFDNQINLSNLAIGMYVFKSGNKITKIIKQ